MSEIYYYAVRNDLKEAIEEMGLTGARFRPCKITAGEYFGDDFSFFENRVFFELQVVGIARFDDLGHDDERYLVASERALRLIHSFSPEELQVLEC